MRNIVCEVRLNRAVDADAASTRIESIADGLGGAMYNKQNAVSRTQGRWPPRANAALQAFLSLSDGAEARGYDGRMHTYSFAAS